MLLRAVIGWESHSTLGPSPAFGVAFMYLQVFDCRRPGLARIWLDWLPQLPPASGM